MRRRDPELWAGLIMLGLLVAVALPGVAGAVPTTIHPAWWAVLYAVTLGALTAAVWDGAPRWRSRSALAVAVLAAGVVVLTAPLGFVAILLVVVAAVAVYVVPFHLVLLVVAVNTGVLLAAGWRAGSSLPEVLTLAGLYLLLQVGSALSCLSLLREQRLRRELAEAHVELQAATALLGESARTAERLRISRELHDSIGHGLTVLSLELEAARHREGQLAREHVVRAGGVARELLGDVRATVGELRSRPADLRAALGRVVDGIPGLEVDLDVADDVRVGEDGAEALVRAVQEIVTNTLRHAQADRLTLLVRRDGEGGTVLEARDDGQGAPELRPGHGLRGMVERFEALGGEVRLDGSAGFAVTARVPSG